MEKLAPPVVKLVSLFTLLCLVCISGFAQAQDHTAKETLNISFEVSVADVEWCILKAKGHYSIKELVEIKF